MEKDKQKRLMDFRIGNVLLSRVNGMRSMVIDTIELGDDIERSYVNDICPSDTYGVALNEWELKYCGFLPSERTKGDYFLIISDNLHIGYVGGKVLVGEHETPVKCLHQLQNLYYSLTGKELISPPYPRGFQQGVSNY